MLPRETSVRQLKKLRAETKGTDIGDLTAGDRLNHNVPNLQYIGNPVDTGIDSYEDFTEKDSKLQTIAFKSKLVNKSIKENKKEIMKENIISFNDFENEAAISYKLKGDDTTRISSGKDKDEATKKASKKEKGQIDPKSIKDYKKIEEDFDDELEDSSDDTDIKVKKYKEPDWENRDIDPSYYEEYGEETHGLDDPTDLDDEDDEDLIDDIEDLEDLEDDDDIISSFANYDKSREDELASDDDLNAEPVNELDDEFESLKESFNKWYASNRNSDILKDEYREYKYESEEEDKLTFKQWCKKRYEYIEEYEGGLEESIKTFEAFSIPAAPKKEKQPEYTILGNEKEPKSNPNFGYGAVRAQEIKKITDFNLIDQPTPKERTIGGSAGVFIDNDTVKGYVNRIEGKDVYVESLDEPMVIKKFSIKDVVKTKK